MLDDYYQHVQKAGKLRSREHAVRWSNAVLNTLGLNLDRKSKRALGKALPDELSQALSKVFWLANFRDTTMNALDFQKKVARRSGNTDAVFARYPVIAVFGGVQTFIDSSLSNQIAASLAPEIRELWEAARRMEQPVARKATA